MTVAWLSESGHARIGGRPSDPYYEPFPSSLRSDQRNRIPIYKVVGRCKLVFLRALLHDVRPLRVTVAGFIRAPFLSTFFFGCVHLCQADWQVFGNTGTERIFNLDCRTQPFTRGGVSFRPPASVPKHLVHTWRLLGRGIRGTLLATRHVHAHKRKFH